MLSEVGSILVTGGAGFVGSWLLGELLAIGGVSRITVLDNLSNGRRAHVPDSPRIALEEIELSDPAAVERVVERCRPDIVFHLAALHFIPYCNAHQARTMEVNVVGTQALLDACRRYPPSRVVIASSVAVYSVRDGANAEESVVAPVDIYGLSKWINERQLELYSTECPESTRCAVARFSNVYGPRETNPHVIPEILAQLAARRTTIALGNVKPKRDYIYAPDVARALIAIVERSEQRFRIYNVGTGREYSVEEIVACLSRISGRPLEIAVDPSRVRATDRMHLLCDLSRIESELGWRPSYTMEAGMTELWQTLEAGDAE